jgi:endoglucanase
MRELVTRMAPTQLRQQVWAYDLVNEPHEARPGTGWGNLPASQWRNLAAELIESIRQAESAAGVPASGASWVVVPTGLYSSVDWPALYGQLVPFADKRVLYTEHYYDPFDFTHQNIPQLNYPVGTLSYDFTPPQVLARLQPLADFSSRTGAPFYLGEFGAVNWAGWSPVSGVSNCRVCPCTPEPWQPRRDASGQPIYDNVNWLRDVMDAANTLGLSWTQHSFRTYEGWDSEYLAPNGPCQAVRMVPGQSDTPAMSLMKRYLTQ